MTASTAPGVVSPAAPPQATAPADPSAQPLLHVFPDDQAGGAALAECLNVPWVPVDLHRFPDGESRIQVAPLARREVVYRSLHDPNAKLVEVLLAASALRDGGATELTLVAPYLPYMRQDIAFHAGEAVSQKVIGALLAQAFDRVVTVEPHLHRTHSLDPVFPGCQTICLSAMPALAALLQAEAAEERPVILGPDEESEPLVRQVAAPLGSPFLVARKQRHGDREVDVLLPEQPDLQGRWVVIVDDVISSGMTVITAAKAALARGAARVEAMATHALFTEAAATAMREAGLVRIRSADGIGHPSNAVALAPLLAEGLRPALALPAHAR